MARAVVPRTAAAVDHADTELIGHDGQLETPGFFVVVTNHLLGILSLRIVLTILIAMN